MRTTVSTFLVLAITAGVILLQIFLSKKENKWLGLILPFITFACSLLTVLSITITDGMTGRDVFRLIASAFFISNIPTVILLAIYFAFRGKIKQKKALERMNIQDLE
ncbi:MAG: hypothetical protein GXY05_09465 [Clostridiales bacterium]|nr:hypothetical protein [Clostridiales bacterium]